MSGRLDAAQVRAMAGGHWDHVFAMLAPSLERAMERPGRHVSCPVHGGRDAFRLYRDYAENGASVCNTCGAFRDGFATLMWLNSWDFRTALERVAAVLGMQPAGSCEVVWSRNCGARCRGTVAFAGEEANQRGRPVFVLRLSEDEGGERRFRGEGLRSAVQAAGVVLGDRVELTLVARQKLKSRTGRTFPRDLWRAERLPQRAEEERLARSARMRSLELRRAIEQGWSGALPFSWRDARVRPMASYLKSRSLMVRDPGLVSGLRFSPAERYRDADGAEGTYPAMIAAVRSVGGDLVTLHRTFLTPEGAKAPVSSPKKLCALPDDATVNGAAIHFGEPKSVLAVAEGIETALSVAIATGPYRSGTQGSGR